MMPMNRNKIRLTVFTPAYNRASTLARTYDSLLQQDCKDFVWLIVDDGSTDDTAELVNDWQNRNNGFEICYIYQKNGGMHTAHNTAYEYITTELNICIDSDDVMGEGAVRKILRKWDQVREQGYAGIIGLDADFSGNVLGGRFPEDMTDTTLTGYYAAGGQGDKKLVYRTDVINSYPPYPVFKGEKYVALAYKYRLIDQDYKLAVLNEVICNVEYQSDGSSNTMFLQYINNPRGFAFWRKVCMKYPESGKRMFIDCIHYVSSSILSRNIHYISESPKKIMTIVVTPLGVILVLYICLKAKTLKG